MDRKWWNTHMFHAERILWFIILVNQIYKRMSLVPSKPWDKLTTNFFLLKTYKNRFLRHQQYDEVLRWLSETGCVFCGQNRVQRGQTRVSLRMSSFPLWPPTLLQRSFSGKGVGWCKEGKKSEGVYPQKFNIDTNKIMVWKRYRYLC